MKGKQERWVPVACCVPTTGSGVRWLGFGGVGVGGYVLGLRTVGGAMKEGKSGNMAIYREDFSEEIGGVGEAGEEDKAEKVLAHPLLQPVETQVYRLGLLRANRRSRKADSAFVIDKKKGRRLLGVVKVGECERELSQHLSTTKSGGILRLCHRRNHYGCALAEGVEGCIVRSGGRQWVGRQWVGRV
jgi:hypothetical protein